jgi:hypothetical protein
MNVLDSLRALAARAIIGACVLAQSVALCAPAAVAPARDGQHDFDDSFGAWNVHVARLDRPLAGSHTWLEYDGTHIITPLWNGRANMGTLDATGPAGRIEAMSPRLYNPATGQWSVRYASSRDGVLGVPHVGRFVNGRGVFIAQDVIGEKVILVRNTYWAESADLHRFEVAYSDDGGLNWETNWTMTEVRTQRAR